MSRELLKQCLDLITDLDKEGLILESGLIFALRDELAKPEQEPFKPDWVNYRQGLADGAAQPEQEPVAWIYDWYGYKSQSETKELVKDWIAAVYSEVSDPTIGAHNIRPLYTTPPRKEWIGLTDEERNRYRSYTLENFGAGVLWAETKLWERNK
jgi:hypothetical protein